MARTWRAALLAAALLALLAAHHWRGWWAPALQRQMQDQPCPADPAADPRLVPGDEGGLCAHRADNARRLTAGTRTELVLLGDSIVAGWPTRFDAKRALALGFTAERDFDEIIRVHIADDLGGHFPN